MPESKKILINIYSNVKITEIVKGTHTVSKQIQIRPGTKE